MLIAKQFRKPVADIIEYREFHTGNTRFFSCKIYSRVKWVVRNFQEISCHHGYRSLAPIVSYFQWWIGYAHQSNHEKKQNPKTNVFEQRMCKKRVHENCLMLR